jgi:hypothetical protein
MTLRTATSPVGPFTNSDLSCALSIGAPAFMFLHSRAQYHGR